MLSRLTTYRCWIRLGQFLALGIGALFISAYVVILHLPGQQEDQILLPFLLADLSRYGIILLFVGMLSACATTGGYLRLLPLSALIFGIPLLLLALYLTELRTGIPHPIVMVELTDGQRFMLAGDPVPTDAVFSLWRGDSRDGYTWQRVGHGLLKYSENGDWLGNYRLVVTPDERRLLVGRGGIWTDCLQLEQRIRLCDGTVRWLDWGNRESWLAESNAIQRLTGLSPK